MAYYDSDYAAKLKELRKKRIAESLTPNAEEQPTTSQKNTWFQGGSFEDGYQFGDVTKAILGTTADIASDLVGGAAELVEGTIDTGAYLVGGIGDLFGVKDFSKGVSDFIAKDIINVSEFTNDLVDYESSSLLGARADSVVQSGGQLAAQIGLSAVGVPWWVTSSVSSFGGSVEGAFQEGATYGQAGLSAAISTGAELLTEKLFGGSGLGEKGLINVEGFTKGISNKVVKSLVDYGIDLGTNAGEEVLSSVISRLGNTLYNGQSFAEALGSEEAVQEYIDSAIGGVLLGGAANIGNITRSVKGGKDYRTGLTANEQKVYDAEYKARVEEAEKGGKRLNGNDRRKLHDDILSDMAKGRISTDTIEKALGGDYYDAYQKANEAQKSLQNEKNKLKSELDKLSGIRKSDMTVAQANRLEELRGKLKVIDKEIAETQKTAPTEDLKSKLSGAVSNVAKDSLLAESYKAKAMAEATENEKNGKINSAIGIDNGANIYRDSFIKQNNKASSKDGVFFDGGKKSSIAPNTKPKTEAATPKAPNLGNVPIRSDIKPKAKAVDLGNVPIREEHKAKAAEAKQTPKTETKAADGKERAFIATATDSKAVGGLVTSDAIPDDVKYYKPITNKDTLDTANKMLNADGFEKAKAHFKKRMESNSVTVEDIVLGERLIQEAAKAGDAKTASELIVDVAALGTELGQKVQALSIIRRLSPEGQLMALERVVKRGQTKGDKTFNGVEITDDMKQRILEVVNKDGSFDQDELNAAVEDVKQQIADQMGVTLSEKLNEWRYLSMLGNPKTHFRNAASNAVMAGERGIKNAIARTIEDIFLRDRKPTLNTEPPIEQTAKKDAKSQTGESASAQNVRTKTWEKATETVKLFAKETTLDMADVIAGDPKYAHETSIKAKRKIFGNKTMDAVSDFNKNALEAADTLFSRSAFRSTFAEYLTANGIKTADDIKNNPELVKKAKDYALEEAYKATFRQESKLAKRLNNLERQNRESGKLGGKIANVAMGAIMPFKKTPINVAKTAVSYSPAGFVRDAVNFFKMRKGEIDASEFIDGVAQSLTGTALLALGVALADAGVLNGAGDDDKEAKYDYQLGKQAYSVNIGGDTYSISWLSPSGVPLLMGATIHELMVDNKGFDAELMIDAATKMLDPVTEMSFVSGLTDVLSSYESGPGAIIDAAETAAQSYVTQYVPTLLSQTAQTFDTKKRITKASPDSKMPFLDETYKKIAYKLPGLRNTLQATTDIWGNDVEQAETLAGRAFEAFLSPANRRQGIATEADAEIKRLYQQTGESGIIPSIPDGYINFGGDKYEMTAKEYTDYKHAYGQTALNLMNDLFETETYKNASDDKRADMVEKVYDYAREMSKNAFFATRDIAYTNAEKDGKKYFNIPSIKGAIDNDMSVEEYSYAVQHPNKYPVVKAMGGYEAYKQYSSDLSDMVADKDVNGKTITNSRKEKVVKYINDLDIGWGDKLILFKSEYTSDNRYNYEIIEYLEERDDISRDEMISILKSLGFTVTKDGRVRW
jgi:hypothetical protein